MKLDFLSTISLSDIGVSVPGANKDGGAEEERKGESEDGGGIETLLQLRKRSRKRRSFMETDYTSTVSFPEKRSESKQDQISNSLYKNLSAEVKDSQILSSDCEPSEQNQNPSLTVSSLTHSEGEPAQLESKPILAKQHLHGPSMPRGFESSDRSREPQAPRTRTQDMEMEPDAMESKSVADQVKAASPTISVVRCRVDPDGKESADRMGDGKEEGEGQGETNRGKAKGDKEGKETTSVSGNGPFTHHMFLPEIHEDSKQEEEKKNGRNESSSGSKRPLLGGTTQPEVKNLPKCFVGVSSKNSNGLLGGNVTSSEQNSCSGDHKLNSLREKSIPPSYSPPPPPPSSPLPPVPFHQNSSSGCFVEEEGGREIRATSAKTTVSGCEEVSLSKQNHSDKAQLHLDVRESVNEEKAVGGVSPTMTISDEVTDSTNSDNVFDDDDLSISLNFSSSDSKDGCTAAERQSIGAEVNKSLPSVLSLSSTSQSESKMTVKSPLNTEAHVRLNSINSDYTRTINSITAKLGAATSVTSPGFSSGTRRKSDAPQEGAACVNENTDAPKRDSTWPRTDAKGSVVSPGLAQAYTGTFHDLSKEPPSPTGFIFQPCSSSIMGRLSASTLRGKIQQLPLYLSRSQETLNQAGVSSPQSPAEDKSREITIKVTDVNNVTQTVDLDRGLSGSLESVASDDSDTTVTGSEVDKEFFIGTVSAKDSYSGSEVKELSSPLPVQTEPKSLHQNRLLFTGPLKNTPGPVTEPPSSIVNSLQRDSSGIKTDAPGPIKDAAPSILPPIVVTTQNLNGPGLPFHSQQQKVRRTSSDRPLMGLCRPTGQISESPKTLASGCRVFTICEGSLQTNTPVEAGYAPPLKPEFGCSSVLASGCETVMEGVQVPLDACGCPPVYTNCFGSGDGFDEELTVYEFSCRSQSSGVTQPSGLGLVTSPPVSSLLSTPSTISPSFPRSILFSSSTSELSPLLSPLSDSSDRFLSQTHKETISRLGQQRYPDPPAGFQVLRVDVDQLLSILESAGADRSGGCYGGRHPRDTCPAHFTENKRVLQLEARRLMSGCQKVVGIGQSPDEMLRSLANSFRTLVELAGICLWFSGCDRCDRRNAEAVAGLVDVARSFRDFCLAAERASSKRSCQDLSTKLLAKQCTALTASVFCLTQLFRTLTAL